MEFGNYQIQIFVSLIVVLGAAFVALIVDFLKSNNEQLRELAIELKVRRQEDQLRAQTVTAAPIAATVRAAMTAPVPVEAEPVRKAEHETVEAPRPEKRVHASRSATASREPKRMPSAAALAAMERGAQLAASPLGQSGAAQRLAAKRQAKLAAETAQEIPATQPIEVAPAEVKAASGFKKDWNSLLARRSQPVSARVEVPATVAAASNRDLLQAVVAETNTQRGQEETVPSAFPAGFHAGFQDGYILSHLVQSRRPVSGLVVSIGVNTARNEDSSMPESVCNLMQSLIGPDDFACQSSPEEFLLIFPGHRGASAQRKLSQIAQQLWDFQLRSLGTFSILFSWGGVEVRSESIEEAISAANERMQETRRGRKLLTMESRNEMPLRQAV